MSPSTLRPFPAEACRTQRSAGVDRVCTITWPSSWQGPGVVTVQDHGQTPRVGRQHGAAEVHTRQALRLSLRAHRGAVRAVLSRGLPCLVFPPGSQHHVDDALLVQVTALGGSEAERDDRVQVLKGWVRFHLSSQSSHINPSLHLHFKKHREVVMGNDRALFSTV